MWSKNITKILPCRFKHSFGPFNMLTVHKWSETELYTHLSNLALQSLISERNNLLGSSFVSKYFKFYIESWKAEKNSKNIFWFGDNCIWIDTIKHSLLLREEFSSGVNVSANSLKISDISKTETFDLISLGIDPKIWQRYCCADLGCVTDTLTCWPSISVLRRGF